MKKTLEILAPAGELEQLKVAVWFGANAVYLAAKDFGMRSAPANFTFDELKQGCEFAHQNGVKVYQTVNVLPTISEADSLENFLIESEKAGVDAFIVADVGVMMVAKRVCPNVEIHISVQAGIVNHLTANELHKLGASRVVLARELTIEEIGEIKKRIPEDLEIEAFVHGAICMAFSGRCLISQYFVNRDSNHGECAQPCRWEYDITDPRSGEKSLRVVEEQEVSEDGNVVSSGSYILNSKDLCLVGHINEIANAGVYSLKIEGRAKSSFYVASVVRCYRAAVDQFLNNPERPPENWIEEEVQKISHREYTTGFYFAAAKDQNGDVIEGRYNADTAPTSLFERGYKQEFAPAFVKLENGWHQRGKVQKGTIVAALTPARGSDLKEPIQVEVASIRDSKTGQEQPSSNHADQLVDLVLLHDGKPVDFPVGTFLRFTL